MPMICSFRVRNEMRAHMIRIREVTKWIFLGIAATALLSGNALSQVLDPSFAFNGTWQREDHADIVTISISGDTAIITNSNGGAGPAKFNGVTIEYSGKVKTDEGMVKTVGTFGLGADGNSLIKRRQIYYASGPQEETSTYTRVSSAPLAFTPTPTPLPTSTPTPTPIPFVGVWRPADDSAKLTITLSGRAAALKYSEGSRDSGTIRGNKIECESARTSDGIKTTDIFEMSSNGRTLIRRRTLQSPKGEIGHETLTYDQGE